MTRSYVLAMPSRTSLVKKAASKVLEPGEEVETASMVSLPGTMKREGRRAMVRGALGIRFVDIDDDAFPEKLLAASTDRRLLLFEQSMLGRAKDLVAEIPFEAIASVATTGTSRAQISLKILEFAVTLRDGTTVELESADPKGAEELLRAVQTRIGATT
jgi:hypothetical protein